MGVETRGRLVIAGFLTFAAVTILASTIFWAVDTWRHNRRLDRHIDEALQMVETPAEDRPDWGAR